MAWLVDPIEIGRLLEASGFDLDPAPISARAGDGGVSGRIVREDRVVTIAVDAGGMARTTVTTRREGAARTIHTTTGLRLKSVATDAHEETAAGRLRSVTDLEAMIAIAIGGSRDPTYP